MTDYEKLFKKNVELSGLDATVYAAYKALQIKSACMSLSFGRLQSPLRLRRVRRMPGSYSILDFGCGDGLMTSFIKQLFPQATVHGVDTSVEHIEVARMAYEDIDFVCVEGKLPFADRSFDVVIASEVLHHIPFDQHEYWMQELMRVLKPGGVLTVLELNPLNLWTWCRVKRDPEEADARLLFPWYAKKLLGFFGEIVSIDFAWPGWCSPLKYLSHVPFGALYIIVVRKNNI